MTPGENSIRSEMLYKSPPTSLSDHSQHGLDEMRGRKQCRDYSNAAKPEDKCDEGSVVHGVLTHERTRKRKRSRKGLDKNFACPHVGCGKTYSRAEHLYRHQLNRELLFSMQDYVPGSP